MPCLSLHRRLCVLLCASLMIVLPACESANDGPIRAETVVARYPDSTRKTVEVHMGDSLIERRAYRRTGALLRVTRGDSVRSYLQLHDIDSSHVLQDYVQGAWHNTSVDATQPNASVFYLFAKDRLTFLNDDRETIETIDVAFDDYRTLLTQDGMPVTTEVVSFDTMRVTGYTLVRQP